jgi:hypothetical protein
MSTKWLVNMNRITHVWTTTLLLTLANVAVATTDRLPLAHKSTPIVARSQPQAIVAPKGKELIAKFDCRSRGPSIGEISLQANGKYTVASRVGHRTNQQMGKYTATPSGYRFSNGKLKGQSIVRQQANIYLISTKNAAKAAEVAAADGALFCTGGEIKY